MPLMRLVPVLRPQARTIAAGLVGSTLAALLALAGPWLVAQAIDVDLPAGDRAGLARRAVLFLLAVLRALRKTCDHSGESRGVAAG